MIHPYFWAVLVAVGYHIAFTESAVVGIFELNTTAPLRNMAKSSGDVLDESDNITFISAPRSINSESFYDNMLRVHSYLEQSNVSVVLGDYDSVYAAVTEDLAVPYVVVDRQDPGKPVLPHIVHVTPSFATYIEATKDLVEHFTWDRLVVFYDLDYGMMFVENLILTQELTVQAYNLNTPLENQSSVSLDSILKDARQRGFYNYIAIASATMTMRLLRQALYLSMLSQQFKWLVVNIHDSPLDWAEFIDTRANVTDLRMLSYWSRESQCLSGMKVGAIRDALQVAVTVAKQPRIRHLDDISNTYKNISFSGCTGIIHFAHDGSRNDNLLQIFTLTGLAEGTMGTWRGHKPMLKQRVDFTYNDMSGPDDSPFGQRTVIVTTIIEKPFVQWTADGEPKYEKGEYIDIQHLEGFLIDLLNAIAGMLKFKFVIYICPDGKFGSLKSFGWTGMINELINKRADFALAPFGITPQRAAVVDYTVPYMVKGIATIIKSPEKRSATFQFLAPLSTNVWIAVFGSYVAASCALFVLTRFNDDKHANWRHNLKEMFWYTWGTLLSGSTTEIPQAMSSRVLIATWWFFSLIMISVYTANLAAFLTVTSVNLPMSTSADLSLQNEYKYGTVEGTQIEYFFNNTKLTNYAKMSAQMKLQPDWMVRRVEDGLHRVKTEKYAFLWDSPTLRYELKFDCKLMEIGRPFDLKGYGMPTQKNARFTDDLSHAILTLSDQDVIRKIEEKWWDKPRCDTTHQSATSTSIGLQNALGFFLVLAGGTLLSITYCVIRNFKRLIRFTIRRICKVNKQDTNHLEISDMSVAPALGNHYEPIVKVKAWSTSMDRKLPTD